MARFLNGALTMPLDTCLTRPNSAAYCLCGNGAMSGHKWLHMLFAVDLLSFCSDYVSGRQA